MRIRRPARRRLTCKRACSKLDSACVTCARACSISSGLAPARRQARVSLRGHQSRFGLRHVDLKLVLFDREQELTGGDGIRRRERRPRRTRPETLGESRTSRLAAKVPWASRLRTTSRCWTGCTRTGTACASWLRLELGGSVEDGRLVTAGADTWVSTPGEAPSSAIAAKANHPAATPTTKVSDHHIHALLIDINPPSTVSHDSLAVDER